jgi:hypothetical protein
LISIIASLVTAIGFFYPNLSKLPGKVLPIFYEMSGQSASSQSKNQEITVISTVATKLFQSPYPYSAIVESINVGQVLEVLNTTSNGEWLKARDPYSGSEGYVQTNKTKVLGR